VSPDPANGATAEAPQRDRRYRRTLLWLVLIDEAEMRLVRVREPG
jgi:hypothetical protein